MTKSPLAGSKKGRNPTDRGKQGVKRSLLNDANELSVVVAAADTDDIKRIPASPDALEAGRLSKKLRLHMGKDYDAEWLETDLKNRRYAPHICSGKEEPKTK